MVAVGVGEDPRRLHRGGDRVKGGRGTAVLLALAGALVVFALVMSFIGGSSVGTDPADSPGSVDNRGRDGTYAWAETLRRLGYLVATREHALDDGVLPDAGVVVLDGAEAVSVQEVDALAAWLGTPGRKLVVAGDTDPKVLRRLVPGLDDATALAIVPTETMTVVEDAPETAGAGELTVAGGASRLLDPGEAQVLYAPHGDDESAYALRYRVPGGGVVVGTADGAVFANDGLAVDENAGFATAVVGDIPGPVVFDQYHHQPARLPGTFGYLPRTIQYGLVQLVVVAVIAALAAGIRRGPARPEPEIPPRRRIEYVQALARSYADADGYAPATERIKADLRDRLRRATALGGDATDDQLVAAAPRAGLDPDAVAAILYGAPTDPLGFRSIAAGATALRRQLTG